MASRRRPRRPHRHGARSHGSRKGGSTILWAGALAAVLLAGGAAAWFVADVLTSREEVDEASLCPAAGPPSALAILLDLTDPLAPAQASRLQAILDREVAAAPTGEMISVGVVSEDPGRWGALFALCKPESGETANMLYENPRLIAERFEDAFRGPFEDLVDATMRAGEQDRSPIVESFQALLSETPHALGEGRPLRIVVVSDLLQHSDLLSFYRGDGWDAFEASGGADRLSRNLDGAQVTILRIPRTDAPGEALAQVDPFWARYFDRQGASAPIDVAILGDL